MPDPLVTSRDGHRPGSILGPVEHHVAVRPDAVALIDGARRRTFAELRRGWLRSAAAIAGSGLDVGDRIAVLDWNSIEVVELLLACAHSGTVLVPMNARLTVAEHAQVLRSARPRLVIAHRDLARTAREAVAAAGLSGVAVMTTGGDDGARDAGQDTYEGWRERAEESVAPRDHHIFCITYTSGSTGKPKGVMIRHEAVTTFLPAASGVWGFDERSVGLVPLPLFHVGAISWMLSSTINGGSAVLLRRPDADEIMDAVERFGGTHINVVPAVLQGMLQSHRARPRDCSTLRTVTCGGAPVPEAFLRAAFSEFGCRVIAFYGLTEAGGGVSHQELLPEYLDGRNAERLLSSGRAIEGITVQIRDLGTAAPVPAGVEGEIVVRTPGLMAGYWDDPDLTARTIDSGCWLRTGDIGYMDAEGYLFLRGRLKDVIISGGENIHAAELENVILRHPGVREACVVARPHERWGETPVAVVVCDESADVAPAAVIAWCREHLAGYKCPTQAVVVPEIPRTATGKYAKNVIRRSMEKYGPDELHLHL
ncbi:class I adenylate-forming enzyme family protein [Actinomadura physcomitrii]|nr:AMP-binding protein [Actinomadura physcomitrii]